MKDGFVFLNDNQKLKRADTDVTFVAICTILRVIDKETVEYSYFLLHNVVVKILP